MNYETARTIRAAVSAASAQRTPGDLPRVDHVTPKEVAAAARCDVSTVRACLRLFETKPNDPRALPYVLPLGRHPYRIRRADALRWLNEEAAA